MHSLWQFLGARLALLALLIGLPNALTAQAAGPVHEGDRVRVRYGSERGVFRVVQLEAEGLVLRRSEASEPMHLPYDRVRELEIDRGPRSRGSGALRGLLWGGLGGVVGGGVIGFVSGDDECDPGSWCILEFTAGEKAAIGAVMLGGIGGASGIVIGALLPGRHWESVAVPIEVGAEPSPSGGLVLRVRFRP